MNADTIINLIKKNKIQWIQIHFTDIFGRLKILHMPAKRFLGEDILSNGFGFDGSSVGYSNVDKSDMLAIPDPSTFLILPHEKNEARIVADIFDTQKNPSIIDPRYALKRAVKKILNKSFSKIDISPEIEFFVIDEVEPNKYEMSKNGGYFCPPPFDTAKELRKELSEILIKSEYPLKYHHHESGKYQHEIEITSLPALGAADFCIYFKYLARLIAAKYNLLLTFMPKPLPLEAGNGMHAHLLLSNKHGNAFFDRTNKHNLSQTARYFIGGILHHSKSITAIANPTVNSYKRLIPHFEAPIYVAWATHNRSSLIRIAAQKNIDVEIRSADPTANPYLLYAALIHAGLDGIKRKIECESIEKNIYNMTEQEITQNKIEKLPKNLHEALYELESDNTLIQSIGKELIDIYIDKKRQEWSKFLTEISDFDYIYYLHY
ncbi:MAG: glutamine synthetase [Candidatus Thermoplasmatota archaeon]|nr:glutamine synthetase [Candidatus Thermoplasmatota archaeon]